jgi:hypothetical protein
VFVLGAGASKPYGFPTSGDIANELWTEFRTDATGPLSRLLNDCGVVPGDVRRFLHAFKESGHYSLDAFVQRRSEFRHVAKLVLADWIIRSETTSLNGPYPPERDDWYRFVFAGMMPRDRSGFANNRLIVITFNFDRSFEYRLMRSLEANYGISGAEAGLLAKSVRVLHVHGQLGTLNAGTEADREFGADEPIAGITRCASDIRLIDEEIDHALIQEAITALDQAQRVFFIGFGFHPDNLERIQANRLNDKGIWGTCQGMSNTDCARTYRFINSPRRHYLSNCSARSLFDSVELFG